MKKSILNLGKSLNKKEQQKINGGKIRCMVNGKCFRTGLGCLELYCQIL